MNTTKGPTTDEPGTNPPGHIDVPNEVGAIAVTGYETAYRKGWRDSATRYLEHDRPFRLLLAQRSAETEVYGATSPDRLCARCEEALSEVVDFALEKIGDDSNLKLALVRTLRNLANRIMPPEQ